MTTSTLHTPLEELLFFQSLRSDGVTPESFAKISDVLKSNEYIYSNEHYDPERLSPGNLQKLYLRLLKDEVRGSSQPNTRQEPEQNSRKRKLSTPPLQSIDEAAEHAHLLPHLVDRLYARYQTHIVEAIKEDERIILETQKAIGEIERGEWDARLQAEQAGTRDARNGNLSEVLRAETKNLDALDNQEQAKGTSLIQHTAEAQAAGSSTPTSQLPQPLPLPPPSPPPLSQIQPPESAPTVPIAASSPSAEQQASKPLPQNYATTLESVSQPASDPSKAPPVIDKVSQPVNKVLPIDTSIPPAAGPARGSGSPATGLDSLSEQSTRPHQQNRQPSTPAQAQLPNLPPHPHTLPQGRNYQHYPNQQYPYAPYGQNAPPFHPTQAGSPQQHGTPNQPAYPNVYAPYGTQSPYGSFPAFPQRRPSYRPGGPPQQPHTVHSTPISGAKRRIQNLTHINTGSPSTPWKSTRPTKAAPRSPSPPPRSPERPASPELSGANQPTSKLQGKLKDASRGESTPSRGRGRGRWAGSSGRGRGGRGGSQTQEPKDATTRSESAHSQQDELASDAKRNVRNEIPSTPVNPTEDTSAISTPGSATRTTGRRNTFRGVELSRPPKRKRANTLEGGSPDVPAPVPPTPHLPSRPGHILASRNFPRVTSTLMNDIMSHKLASIFAKPITERDVPGYQSLIYQPQDLKSIRLAISAGSRYLANNAATTGESVAASADESGAAATPPAATASTPITATSSSRLATQWVERVPDVLPPRGIVNSAQLEKEITRVFANAVIFNPDPYRGFGVLLSRRRESDGNGEGDDDESVEGHYEVDDGGAFTRDAREMFEEVERSVARWRAAERVEPGGSSTAAAVADTRKTVEKGDDSEDELADEGTNETGTGPEPVRGRRSGRN